MNTTPLNLITRAEAARRAGVGVRTIARWLAAEVITRHANELGHVRVDANEIDRLTAFRPSGGDAT